MLNQLLFGLLLISLFMSGCGTAITVTPAASGPSPSPEPRHMSNLEGSEWLLQALGTRRDPQPSLAGVSVTAHFDPVNGVLTGMTGCNDYTATYQIDGERISIGSVEATQKACGEVLGMQQMEMAFINILENISTYQLSDEKLTLATDDNRILIFIQP